MTETGSKTRKKRLLKDFTSEEELELEGKLPGVCEKGVLRTENLVKKYGKRTVANKVSIDVTQGEIVGLLFILMEQARPLRSI